MLQFEMASVDVNPESEQDAATTVTESLPVNETGGEKLPYPSENVVQPQQEGPYYDESYLSVVRFSAIRYLMAVAVRLGLKIHQLNAVTASRQIVEQLEGFGGRSKQVSYGTRSSKRYLLRDIGLQQSKWREGSHRGRICGRPSAVSAVPAAEPRNACHAG